MRIHPRNTYQSGADAMLDSHSWHSSKPLGRIEVGDILRVKNKDTLEKVDWKVTEPSVSLSPEEAKREWESLKFYDERDPKRYGYFPYVLRNLVKIREYPPEKPTPRYIPYEIRSRVWLRDGRRCKRCGATSQLEFDHVIPISKGGSSTENNIEVLCRKCNREKRDQIQ